MPTIRDRISRRLIVWGVALRPKHEQSVWVAVMNGTAELLNSMNGEKGRAEITLALEISDDAWPDRENATITGEV
jgi:hypothetical protein